MEGLPPDRVWLPADSPEAAAQAARLLAEAVKKAPKPQPETEFDQV